MIAASLACLVHGGAFAEVGKRDIWSPARVAQVLELRDVHGCCMLQDTGAHKALSLAALGRLSGSPSRLANATYGHLHGLRRCWSCVMCRVAVCCKTLVLTRRSALPRLAGCLVAKGCMELPGALVGQCTSHQ